MRIGVVGASGFMGNAVANAAEARGLDVVRIKSPRVTVNPNETDPIQSAVSHYVKGPQFRALAKKIAGCDVLVNCAGDSRASSRNNLELFAANAAVPAILDAVVREVGVRRFVHVSSAAVQGRRAELDSSRAIDGFSVYARSKAAGESLLLDRKNVIEELVIFRPGGVHHPSRSTSRKLLKIAKSPFAVVAAPGNDPTPQSLVGNVADAILFLILYEGVPPRIVSHPGEDMTTEALLWRLGGKKPLLMPRTLAVLMVFLLRMIGQLSPSIGVNVRRIEMILFGQKQADKWLYNKGWKPPLGAENWNSFQFAQRINFKQK